VAAIPQLLAAWAVPTGQELQQQMTGTMRVMLPLTIASLAFVTAAGLGLCWFVSNCCSIIQQYFVAGRGGLLPQAPGPVPRTTRRATE
jgi:membrane protein insertase Oxa1/YidC/SpoIIIJ